MAEPHPWQSPQKLSHKRDFDFKVNGKALGAALRHSLGWLQGHAQTQDVSKLEAVTEGNVQESKT